MKLLFSCFRTDSGSFGYALVKAETLAQADAIFNTYILGTQAQRLEIEHLLFDAVTGECFTELESAR